MLRSLSRLACFVALAGLGLVAIPRGSTHATSPCDFILGDPRPPLPQPEPLISGTIVDSVNAAVSGATVKLYRCEGTSAEYVAQTTTGSMGTYSFGSLSENWYFVEVALTGPLSGKSPVSGTVNPSSLIEVGEGATGLNFAFE